MYLTLFGTPSGFAARTYGRPPFEVDDRWIDSRNEMPLDDGEWAVLVSRRFCPQGLLTWIGLYRPAHEIHVSRGGQYGAGLWLLNQAAPGPESFALLTAVADEMARLALANGKFTRTIDAFEAEIRWPDALGAAVRKALRSATQAGVGTGDKPMLLMDASAPDDTAACGVLIDLAQGGAGLRSYQRMLITALPRVVRQVTAFSQTVVTTPAKWQQGVEAVVDAATKRTHDELQAALADAELMRKDMVAMRERLLADHARAMEVQSARLTAEFDRQLQTANAKLGELEPAFQRASSDLVAMRSDARKSQEAISRLEELVDDYQADAGLDFYHSQGLELAPYAALIQELERQAAALQDALAVSDTRLKSLEQDNQSLRGRLNVVNRQINEDAERHQREVRHARLALEADMAALRAANETASIELDTARRTIESLRSNDRAQREQLTLLQSRRSAPLLAGPDPRSIPDPDDSLETNSTPAMPTLPWAYRASPMAVAMTVVLLIAGISVLWGLRGNKPAPDDRVTTPAAGPAATVLGQECAAAWLPDAVTTSPTVSAPSHQHPLSVADAVLLAACSPRRLADCRDLDQRELAQQLNAHAPAPGAANWTFKVNLPQGCKLDADSTWEWSSRGLIAQRVYTEPPSPLKKEPVTPANVSDKQAKANGNRASQKKEEETRGSAAKPEVLKAGAAAGAAAASKGVAGTVSPAVRANASGSANGALKPEPNLTSGDKSPAVSSPVVSSGGGGESAP